MMFNGADKLFCGKIILNTEGKRGKYETKMKRQQGGKWIIKKRKKTSMDVTNRM